MAVLAARCCWFVMPVDMIAVLLALVLVITTLTVMFMLVSSVIVACHLHAGSSTVVLCVFVIYIVARLAPAVVLICIGPMLRCLYSCVQCV